MNKVFDTYRGLFLLVSVVLMVVLSPLWEGYEGKQRSLLMLGFIFAIGFGGYLMAGTRKWLVLFGVLVCLSLVLTAVDLSIGSGRWNDAAIEIISLIIYTSTIVVALRFALFGKDVVPLDRVLGGITGYFLIGLAWVHVFYLIQTFDPRAITMAHGEGGLAGREDLLYYSFITLTTQGYGEIVPINPYARVAAAMEGVIGTLYIAILIASLVSDLRQRKSREHAL